MAEESKVPGSSLRARLKQYQDLKDKAQSAASAENPAGGDEENKPPADSPADAPAAKDEPAGEKPAATGDPPADPPTDASAADTAATASATADSAPDAESEAKEEPAAAEAEADEVAEEEVVDEEIVEDEVVEEEVEYEEVVEEEVGEDGNVVESSEADVEEEILENSQAVFDDALFPQDDQSAGEEAPFEDEAEEETTDRPILIPPTGPMDPVSPASPVAVDPESQEVKTRSATAAARAANSSDEDAKSSNRRGLIYCLAIVAVLAIVAIILPFVIDRCKDCKDKSGDPSPSLSPTVDPDATLAPTTLRLGHFIRTWVVPLSGAEAVADRDSPQYLASEFLADEDEYVPEMTTIAELSDRFGLIVFYFATGGDSWDECFRGDNNCESPWLSGAHCDWTFVSCNEGGRVNSVIFRKFECNNFGDHVKTSDGLFLTHFASLNNCSQLTLMEMA